MILYIIIGVSTYLRKKKYIIFYSGTLSFFFLFYIGDETKSLTIDIDRARANLFSPVMYIFFQVLPK